MKKTVRFIGIIAFVAVIGYTMTACDSGSTNEIGNNNGGGGNPVVPVVPTVPTVINESVIRGVTPPEIGAIPVTQITDTAQYSGTVTWSPNHSTFASSVQYTATIILTPKTGYTLQGVSSNFFTVAGATATNAAYSGVITAVFPQISEVLTVSSTTEWNNALNHIAINGNGAYNNLKSYIIVVNGDISVPVVTQTFGSVTYVEVTLRGNGTLSLNSNGNMIQTSVSQTLIIDSANLTLQGPTNNNTPLINCSKLEMKNGTIKGGVNGKGNGGVLCVSDFTMSGGIINGSRIAQAGNSFMNSIINSNLCYGGGVYVTGNFIMSGGTISGNCITEYGYGNISCGGGVYVVGNFTMSGGTISGSSSSCGTFYGAYGDPTPSLNYDVYVHSYGGGVYVGAEFIKTGGIIYGNNASDTNKNTVSGPNSYGHAVYCGKSPGFYHDATLGENDNLYSTSPMPVNSGESLNGWTKR